MKNQHIGPQSSPKPHHHFPCSYLRRPKEKSVAQTLCLQAAFPELEKMRREIGRASRTFPSTTLHHDIAKNIANHYCLEPRIMSEIILLFPFHHSTELFQKDLHHSVKRERES
ncbi:hypothetical protein Droror1_Dr00002428 [Drosera rotundifolia]